MRLRSSLLFHLQLKLETNVLSSGTSTLAIAACILGGPVSSEFFFSSGPILLLGAPFLCCGSALLSFELADPPERMKLQLFAVL